MNLLFLISTNLISVWPHQSFVHLNFTLAEDSPWYRISDGFFTPLQNLQAVVSVILSNGVPAELILFYGLNGGVNIPNRSNVFLSTTYIVS